MKGNRAALAVISAILLIAGRIAVAAESPLDSVVEVHIPAQGLADALITLGRQSGMQIMTAAVDLEALRAQPVDGRMSVRDALAALLRGTALQYRQVGDRSIAIRHEPLPSRAAGAGTAATAMPTAPAPGAAPAAGAVALQAATELAIRRSAFAASIATEPLQEIVVTAEKLPVDVMHAPVSMTAINGADLQVAEVRELQELQFYVAGLSISVVPNGSTLNIRGIGLTFQSPNIAQGVPLYRDGLLVPTSVGDEPLWDLANVQVLRGPQGTLVGANSTGGAVFINTVNPALGTGTHGDVRVMAGEYRHLQAQATTNVDLGETLAARLGIYVEQRDSFSRNLTAADSSAPPHPGRLGMLAWRASMLWQPTDALQMLGRLEYFRNGTDYAAEKPLVVGSTSVNGLITVCPAPGSEFNSDPMAWSRAPQTCGNSAFAPASPYDLAYARNDAVGREQIWRESVEARLQFADHAPTLRLLAGAAYNTVQLAGENTASLNYTGGFTATTHEHTLTYEADLLSPSGPLQWVLGGFWWRDPSQFLYTQLNYSGGPFCVGTTVSGMACSRPSPGSLYLRGSNVRTNYALFGNAKYPINDRWAIEGGMRETWDVNSNPFQACTPADAPDGPDCQSGTANAFHFLQINAQNPWGPLSLATGANSGFPNFGEESDRLFTWKAAVDYAVSPQSYLYGELATGAKAGGIRTNHLGDNFAPEKNTDFELGWKATLAGRITVQLDGFYMRYTNMQVRARTTADGQDSIFNAGSADDYGLELAAQGDLGNWRLAGTASWTKSSFNLGDVVNDDACGLYRPCGAANNVGQCPPGVPSGGVGGNGATPCFDYRSGGVTINGQFFPFVASVQGLQLPNSPRFQGNFALGYRFMLSGGDTLTPRLELSYQDKQYVAIYNTPLDLFSSRREVNVKLSYVHRDWLLETFITNLTNETYPVAQNDQQNELFNAPQQFGVRVTRRF